MWAEEQSAQAGGGAARTGAREGERARGMSKPERDKECRLRVLAKGAGHIHWTLHLIQTYIHDYIHTYIYRVYSESIYVCYL